jgi:hypothetical protein
MSRPPSAPGVRQISLLIPASCNTSYVRFSNSVDVKSEIVFTFVLYRGFTNITSHQPRDGCTRNGWRTAYCLAGACYRRASRVSRPRRRLKSVFPTSNKAPAIHETPYGTKSIRGESAKGRKRPRGYAERMSAFASYRPEIALRFPATIGPRTRCRGSLLWVDLASSPSRPGTAAICAFRSPCFCSQAGAPPSYALTISIMHEAHDGFADIFFFDFMEPELHLAKVSISSIL